MLAFAVSLAAAITPSFGAQAAPVTSPDPAKAALIEELFQFTKPEQMMAQFLAQYKAAFARGAEQAFDAQVRKFDDPAKYQPALHQFENQMFALIAERLSWEQLKPRLVQIYSDTFTTDELSGILTFYKSPAGQAVLRKMPGLMTQCSAMGQQQCADLGPQIQKMMSDFCANLKKIHDAEAVKPAKKS